MRSVSELVSAALLALIAITVGGLVVALLVNNLAQQRSQIETELVKQLYSSRQALGVVLAYVDNTGHVKAVVATGDTPTRIKAVYINGEQVDCSMSLTDGTSLHYNQEIPPYTAVIIDCPARGTAPYSIRILYPGGSVVAVAK